MLFPYQLSYFWYRSLTTPAAYRPLQPGTLSYSMSKHRTLLTPVPSTRGEHLNSGMTAGMVVEELTVSLPGIDASTSMMSPCRNCLVV